MVHLSKDNTTNTSEGVLSSSQKKRTKNLEVLWVISKTDNLHTLSIKRHCKEVEV